MFCVKLVKCVLEQLTVMVHIAIVRDRTFRAKFRECDRPTEATIVYRKIVLVAVNSTLYDTDCNEVKLKKDSYRLRIA